jgi:hypothetical protein
MTGEREMKRVADFGDEGTQPFTCGCSAREGGAHDSTAAMSFAIR